jgi:hypothetical protein
VLALGIILLKSTSRYLYAFHAIVTITVAVDKFEDDENNFSKPILMYEYIREAKLV